MSPAFQPRPGAGIPLAVLAFGLALGAGVAIANGLEFAAAPLVAASAAVCVVAAGGARTGYPAVFIPIAAAWSEAAVFAGAAWLLGGGGNHAAAFGAFAATTGALAQSYTVARGAVVGVDVAEGPVRQAVRAALLAAALALGVLEAALWPIAVLALGSALLTFARLLRALAPARGGG